MGDTNQNNPYKKHRNHFRKYQLEIAKPMKLNIKPKPNWNNHFPKNIPDIPKEEHSRLVNFMRNPTLSLYSIFQRFKKKYYL